MATWYLELSHPKWELSRLQAACRAWLRSTVTVHDWQQENQPAKQLLSLRHTLTHTDFSEQQRIEAAISIAPGSAPRLHLLFNGDQIKSNEWGLLERQLPAFYQQPLLELKPTGSAELESDYWDTRLETLPPAPLFNSKLSVLPDYYYSHLYDSLTQEHYKQLQHLAEQEKLSLAVVLLTMLVDSLQSKVLFPWFRINLSLLNRVPLYPYLGDRASYATSLSSLALTSVDGASFIERAHAFDQQLHQDMLHLKTENLAQLNQAENTELSTSPLVLTIAVEQGIEGLEHAFYSEPANILYYEGFQPKPRFMIDVWEQQHSLHYRWSFIEKLFTE